MILSRRALRIVVLAAFAALPVSGTLCAVFCTPPAAAELSAHHAGGDECATPERPSGERPQIDGVAAHDCRTHDTGRFDTSTRIERFAVASAPSGLDAMSPFVDRAALSALRRHHPAHAPPAAAPPTALPLVLRV